MNVVLHHYFLNFPQLPAVELSTNCTYLWVVKKDNFGVKSCKQSIKSVLLYNSYCCLSDSNDHKKPNNKLYILHVFFSSLIYI